MPPVGQTREQSTAIPASRPNPWVPSLADGSPTWLRIPPSDRTLNRMVQYLPVVLDRTFSALADSHRRQILDRLGEGPVSISELAAPLGMSLPGVLKHVRALEAASLVETQKRGRTRWCRLKARPLDGAAEWIEERRALWNRRLDRFERHVDDLNGEPR
jgi:DNA-binding transcriptional ArsR family regulator